MEEPEIVNHTRMPTMAAPRGLSKGWWWHVGPVGTLEFVFGVNRSVRNAPAKRST